MPRALPWLLDAAKNKKQKQPRTSFTTAPKRKRESSPEDLVNSDLDQLVPTIPPHREKKLPARTPSTSPPPAPPDVEYMREGYNGDDIYMMVEDEFFSTAKLFTQHIHHAEYVRLKKMAKARGKGALEDIDRGTDGRTARGEASKRREEAGAMRRKVKAGHGNDDESSDEADEYMHDPQLAGLMMGKRTGGRDLSGLAKTKSNTRAAAGFEQSPHNVERKKDVYAPMSEPESISFSHSSDKLEPEEDLESTDDDEDDLDVKPAKFMKTNKAKAASLTQNVNGYSKSKREIEPPEKRDKPANIFKQFASTSSKTGRREEQKEEKDSLAFESREKTAPLSSGPAASSSPKKHASAATSTQQAKASEYSARRRAEKERKEQEQKRKEKKINDIPTFMF